MVYLQLKRITGTIKKSSFLDLVNFVKRTVKREFLMGLVFTLNKECVEKSYVKILKFI